MAELSCRHLRPMIVSAKDQFLESCFIQKVPGPFDDIQLVPADELFPLSKHTVVDICDVVGSAVITDGVVGQIIVLFQVKVFRILDASLKTVQVVADAQTIMAGEEDELVSVKRISANIAVVGIKLVINKGIFLC